MKLNKKGFAITAVLYGLLILFVVLVSSYLLILSARKDRVDKLVSDIEKSYHENHPTEDPENPIKDNYEIIFNFNARSNYVESISKTVGYGEDIGLEMREVMETSGYDPSTSVSIYSFECAIEHTSYTEYVTCGVGNVPCVVYGNTLVILEVKNNMECTAEIGF